MPRTYDLSLKKNNISRHRYRELKEFCLQYNEKKSELENIYSSTPSFEGGSSGIGKPTEQKAIRAMQLRRDVDLIDQCLAEVTPGEEIIRKKLKENITTGLGYDCLGYVPCGINQFYTYRKRFFALLDKKKQ
ncbi:MAG: hypothetical protein E7558_00175 [Ruminococcaceae bacterium]|nr:hypothetical protein [Oscillospiraceae bacterium]